MKAAQLPHDVIAGAHMEMIRIGQFHLCADLFQIRCGDSALNGGHRAHIHEHRRLYHTMNRMKFGAFRAAVFFEQFIHSFDQP